MDKCTNNTGSTRIECEQENCPLNQQLRALCNDVRDVRMAVCGDKALGVNGLVRDMADLQTWRKKVDLRVASIGGVGGAVVMLAKWLLER